MATLYRVPTQNALQYTLDAALTAGGTSLTLNQSVTGVVRAPGVVVIDRVDASGNATASKREYISFTGVSGAQLTGLSRGLASSTDQVHSVGAIVEFTPDVVQEQEWYAWGTTEHTVGGVHASMPSVSFLKVYTHLNASGASLSGFQSSTLNTTTKARAYKSGAQNISTVAKVELDAESYDPGSNFDAVTNFRFTAPTTGYYAIAAQLTVSSMADGKILNTIIRKNGSDILVAREQAGAASSNVAGKCSDIISLNASDYIELFGQTDDASRAISQSANETFLAIHLIST